LLRLLWIKLMQVLDRSGAQKDIGFDARMWQKTRVELQKLRPLTNHPGRHASAHTPAPAVSACGA
jgi:hypothetical protein